MRTIQLYFIARAEVEGLYQTLSEHAGANGLIISKIIKKGCKRSF